MPAVIVFLLARPYPFSPYRFDADIFHLQDISKLSVDERKVLTFWTKSGEIRKVIWKSEIYLLLFTLSLMTVSLVFVHLFDRKIAARLANISLHDISWQTDLIGLFVEIMIYFIFSFFFVENRLARFLKKNIDRIAAMDIEPWPTDKPYMPASAYPRFTFFNSPQNPNRKLTYVDEILRIDPNIPFTWPMFLRLIRILVTLIACWIVVTKLSSILYSYITSYFRK